MSFDFDAAHRAPPAPWASDPAHSGGRRVPEASAAPRSEYQRDRDRIVHSNAFRRLVYKTQVFINHEGDLFRTRLTHSLEVAQLGRSMARQLRLNEDLVEAIALAHDLGHTPFGHAGQDALAQCMKEHGGFEHNLQSLRVVDRLEQRYAAFDGLNLTLATREGILKHCTRTAAQALEADEPGGVARRFLHGWQPSLEAQLVNLADEIAYQVHDIDDGVRSGLLAVQQLEGIDLYVQCRDDAQAAAATRSAERRRLLAETLRRMLAWQVDDLVRTTREAIVRHQLDSAQRVREAPAVVAFSAPMRASTVALKRLLFAELYRHPRVQQTMALAREVIGDLFAAYLSVPEQMPDDFRRADTAARGVADYIAGMTDRFALREHQRLTGRDLFGSMR